MKTFLSILLVLCSFGSVFAGEKLSDEATKKKLLGYWESPRHAYLIKSDGLMYMCPRKFATTKDNWDVKDGHFYQLGHEYEIVTLTDKKFVYRGVDEKHATYTLLRTTEKLAEGE